ncbi:MAG: hypothetical protein F6K42_24575 [Leptolyngbya sp. SIO1D8]|nr:hypothetical protein [Leptolyngbya sp. SIO1D8]
MKLLNLLNQPYLDPNITVHLNTDYGYLTIDFPNLKAVEDVVNLFAYSLATVARDMGYTMIQFNAPNHVSYAAPESLEGAAIKLLRDQGMKLLHSPQP